MKTLHGIIIILIALATVVSGQIMPQQQPVDTEVGGTGASRATLKRLKINPTKTKVMRNLLGPTEGGGRSRHDIQIYKITEANLPGVNNYFLRSSYVILEPGGSSPIHSHHRRSAFLQVISGSVMQHRSDGTSFLMGPGDFTFSSDDLTHWWINESPDTPMRLWVVEICTTQHGCKEAVDGGAIVLKSRKARSSAKRSSNLTIHEINLATEFSDAKKIGKRMLRLREIRIKPGQENITDIEKSSDTPGYFRVAKGNLTVKESGGDKTVKEGSILFVPDDPSSFVWSNRSGEEVILYSVQIVNLNE